MADKQNFGYQQTLLYGQYTRELGTFAKFQAKQSKLDRKDKGHAVPTGCRYYLARCAAVRDVIFHKIGEDWVFLAMLGIIMALLSFTMDYIIEKCQEAKIYLYHETEFNVALQFLVWISYSLIFILFATGFTHIVSPQAIGSGIPEMKTILRGVVLKEYLTFRTLIAKIVGLCSTLGSTLPFGKEGPFVHIASIVATLLSKVLSSFRGIYENESRKSEMLAAACAVGVACTFAAPIGGVLFSIEVTATYFAVRNYWRGFFSAVCGALVFRLLALWFRDEETITAVFKTALRTEFPFDALELIAFSLIGVVCGLAGPLFIFLHRKIILFTRKHKKLSCFLQKNRFIYPGLVSLLISSLTFPPGLGQFFAGELTHRQAINELFSNITWTTGQADDLTDEEIISHWKHPLTNIYSNLVLFIIMNFWMVALSNTLPVPAGIFVPVFTIGAAFGRLTGESMAAFFPAGIRTGTIIRKIVPGGYAVVGAAALAGSVTRTISTSVIVFEITGQISHILPAVIAVLLANAVAHPLQPSFYESIIRLKKLPYLPDIMSAKSSSWTIYVEDIMVRDLKFITFSSKYEELKDLLVTSSFRSYPLVDSPESMILLGSIQRVELEHLLWLHINREHKVFLKDIHPEDEEITEEPESPPPQAEAATAQPPKTRFQVTKVEEKPKSEESVSSDHVKFDLGLTIPKSDTYASLRLPTKSILKKSPQVSPKMPRRGSTGNMMKIFNLVNAVAFAGKDKENEPADDFEAFFKSQRSKSRDSIVEDVPYFINRGSFGNLRKSVEMPADPVKVKFLSHDDQEAWERHQLDQRINFEGCQIDPAPFQLVEHTSLHKIHSLFSLLGLSHAYVTNTGRLMGVVALKELRLAVQGHINAEGKFPNGDTEDEVDFPDPQQLEVEVPEESMPFTIGDATKENAS